MSSQADPTLGIKKVKYPYTREERVGNDHINEEILLHLKV